MGLDWARIGTSQARERRGYGEEEGRSVEACINKNVACWVRNSMTF